MYTEFIPIELAKELEAKGCPCNPERCSYAKTIDWFGLEGLIINLNPAWNIKGELVFWSWKIYRVGVFPSHPFRGSADTWNDAALAAIRKALERI